MLQLIHAMRRRFFSLAVVIFSGLPAIIFAQNRYWQESAKIFNPAGEPDDWVEIY